MGLHGHASLRGHFPCVFPTFSSPSNDVCRGRHGDANLRGYFLCVFPTFSGCCFTLEMMCAWVFMGMQTSGDTFLVFFQRILAAVSPLKSCLHGSSWACKPPGTPSLCFSNVFCRCFILDILFAWVFMGMQTSGDNFPYVFPTYSGHCFTLEVLCAGVFMGMQASG